MKILLILLMSFYQGLEVAEAISVEEYKPLMRKAQWHTKFKSIDKNTYGREIKEIKPQSALVKAGLKIGDRLIKVNHQLIDTQATWNDITDALVANINYTLTFSRKEKLYVAQVKFKPIDKESYKNIDVIYGEIINNKGDRQRTILTRPDKLKNKYAAIFIVQGLSCSSIEYTPGRKSNFIKTIQNIITGSNMVVMRVEKPGLGDSEGNCSQTNFNTELSGYEKALKHLLKQDYIDPNKVVVYGSSMGSALAPYLANKYKLNGVIADGPFYRSWFEHMLEIERRIKTMQGLKQDEISHLMNRVYIPLYYNMLINKMSYEEIVQLNPSFTAHNYHQNNHMYGRPMSYYHQLQDFDIAGTWQKLSVPVRVRWGTNDWIMSEYDINMIEEVLNKNNHQDYKIYKFPGLDHWSTIHTSADDSFNGNKGEWDNKISQQIIDWAVDINNNYNR